MITVVTAFVAAVTSVGVPAAPLRLALRSVADTAVELILENVSDKPLAVPKAISFRAGKGMYWAPAYVTAGAIPGSVNVSVAKPDSTDARRGPVTLAPRESRKVVIQLADLKWSRTIGESWPNQGLAATIPAGRHPVVVELAFENADGAVRSNEAVILLPKQ
jgi:hypothetical protein